MKNIFSKRKKSQWEEWHCFKFLQISLRSRLIEGTCILTPASEFNLCDIGFGEIKEENLGSYRCIVGKGRSIRIAFQIIVNILWNETKLNKW